MTIRALYLAIAFGATALSPAAAAPIQWSAADGGNDHWYELNTDPLTWDTARQEAEDRGGYLATVTSADENDFIAGLLSNFELSVWLGGSDAASEGDWYWVTGPEAGTQFWEGGFFGNTVGPYENWSFLEPNNGLFLGEDYLAIWSVFSGIWPHGGWKDLGGDWPQASLVEYDSNPFAVPEPASAALTLVGLAGLAWRRRKSLAR